MLKYIAASLIAGSFNPTLAIGIALVVLVIALMVLILVESTPAKPARRPQKRTGRTKRANTPARKQARRAAPPVKAQSYAHVFPEPGMLLAF